VSMHVLGLVTGCIIPNSGVAGLNGRRVCIP